MSNRTVCSGCIGNAIGVLAEVALYLCTSFKGVAIRAVMVLPVQEQGGLALTSWNLTLTLAVHVIETHCVNWFCLKLSVSSKKI